jgi:hypothetical protein
MRTKLSTHAAARRQQRAIPAFVIELLEACGSERRCGGAEKLIFDKVARKRLKHYLGGERGLHIVEPWLKVYAIIGDNGCVVTTAHTSRRHRHH